MEFVANYMSPDLDPARWARTREEEGWAVLGCGDHLWSENRPYPHMWVSLGAMAVATSTARLTTSFCNNLLRSPVEVAQAALQMQAVSGGRFELGLGAGWAEEELVGAGLRFPPRGERAGRYREAVEIIVALLRDRRVCHRGHYYEIDVPRLGPAADPPPIVASLGGPRTIREIAPLVNRVELMILGEAPAGATPADALLGVTEGYVRELVDRVRSVRPDVPLTMFCVCSVTDDPRSVAIRAAAEGRFVERFFGPPELVATSLRSLAELGVDRVHVSPFGDRSFELLAPFLSG